MTRLSHTFGRDFGTHEGTHRPSAEEAIALHVGPMHERMRVRRHAMRLSILHYSLGRLESHHGDCGIPTNFDIQQELHRVIATLQLAKEMQLKIRSKVARFHVISTIAVLALLSLSITSCFIGPQPEVVRTIVEKEVEVPVEVVVEKEVEVPVEVPVEVIVEKEVIREVEVPVEVPVEVVVEREVIREVEVPVEVIKEVVVEREVIREVVVEVPVVVPPEPTVPQVVRLVGIVPAPGSVILDDLGDTETLSVQGYYSDQSLADLALNLVTYESSDSSVVSVTPDGVVTANGPGWADIVVEFGGFSERVHALVFGDIPTLPPIDPDMVGVIPGLHDEAQVVKNRVIVELHPGLGTSGADDIAMALGGQVVFSYRNFPGYVIEFDSQTRDLNGVIAHLSGDDRVEAAYPDVVFEATDHPIDSLTFSGGLEHEYKNAGFEGAWGMMEKVPALHPVLIWIIEKGNLNVADQNAPIVVREEFDERRFHVPGFSPFLNPVPTPFKVVWPSTGRHAAQVAGIIAARNHQGRWLFSDNGLDPRNNFSGIVTSVEGLPYDIVSLNLDPNYDLLTLSNVHTQFDLLADLKVKDIDVANMSFGMNHEFVNLGRLSKIVESMPKVVFVPAAGNKSVDAGGIFPANLSLSNENVITVGASHPDNASHLQTSAYGKAVTLLAPGRVWSVDVSDPSGYGIFDGTSASAPMVSGAIALFRSVDPEITPGQIKKYLVDNSDKRPCTYTGDQCPSSGEWSFLRADKAIARFLSDRVAAEISDGVTIPADSQRVIGSDYEFDVSVHHHGSILWEFYVEATVTPPGGGDQDNVTLDPVEVRIAPQTLPHPVRFGFSPDVAGCWDLSVRVWMEDPDPSGLQQTLPSHLRTALAELNPPADIELASKDWPGVLEVRSDPNTPEPCATATSTTEIAIGLGRRDANVLLLADTSSSMEGLKSQALNEAIELFANRLYEIRVQAKGGVDPDPDYIGLIDFDHRYREVVPIGPIDPKDPSLQTWTDAINSLDTTDSGTALYDAIIRSVDYLEDQGDSARDGILIALTDGVDRNSNSSLGDAIAKLEGSSITLFALGLSEPGGTDHYDFSVLQELATAGRGTAYAADTVNVSGLYELFTTIFEIAP